MPRGADKGRMARMPKRLPIAVSTPESVEAAAEAFGSELRLHLIGYFAVHRSRQADAMRALAVDRQTVHVNTAVLEATGALVRHPDLRYSVDRERVRELLDAVEQFVLPGLDD